VLGVDVKKQRKFSMQWYMLKRNETAALWNQRQKMANGVKANVFVRIASSGGRSGQSHTMPNAQYEKMSRKQMERLVGKERVRQQSQRVVVEAKQRQNGASRARLVNGPPLNLSPRTIVSHSK
jgi:N-acetylmuramoyl-L-alanine amidase